MFDGRMRLNGKFHNIYNKFNTRFQLLTPTFTYDFTIETDRDKRSEEYCFQNNTLVLLSNERGHSLNTY